MTPLASRKLLLIAESDLNRVCLVAESGALAASVRSWTTQVASLGTLAASAAALVSGLSAPKVPAKAGWMQMLLDGAGMATSLWKTFRQR